MRARSGRWRERLTPKRVHAPSLDWLNFLVADVRGALGPFVVVYLASEAHWDAATVGLVTSIGGWIGLSAQTPIGAWLDRTPHKRGLLITALVLLSVGAVMVAWWPRFWPVLAANSLMQVVSGVFEPAIAALTLGLCTRETLTRRMGRNAAWSRAGNIVVAVTSGLLAWLVSAEAVFLQVPVIAALTVIAVVSIPKKAVDGRRARGLETGEGHDEGPAGWFAILRSGPMLAFAACSFLYELASAPLLTLVGQMVGQQRPGSGLTFTSGCIIASQFGMLASSILVGRRADAWGARGMLAAGFVLLPVQAVLTMLTTDPGWLLAIQVVGGLGGGFLFALTPIWLADATRGSGRYNLAQGVVATVRALGVTSSAVLGEFVVDRFGYAPAYGVCGGLGIAAAVLIWVALAERGQPAAAPARA
ncbi:MAG: hypothetical protein BGO51_14270 [Rhodospirillales bacterium 69-11]|nr:MAG: hypothetical protein BGO51_14270 [Rhodospirillales bacterium 69-11]